MRAKIIERQPQRTYAVIFDKGEEFKAGMEAFAKSQGLRGSDFTAIGAFEQAKLGWFDWETKEYKQNPINEQMEVVSLVGNIAIKDGEPRVHAHVAVATADGIAHGGHVMEAYVRPTVQLILRESPEQMQTQHDPESGLALIEIAPEQDILSTS
ncbi:MAG: DNA-binding protein [Chroococcidiopsidaceae cyanobacterium CP_BM_ER_R8_30]|nr:DNA-binding protein [Chroococcidiopsidaceae cyanobacterium CP_BM_ER_R8_30]